MEDSPHALMIDDHRDIREPLARFLEEHNIRVTVADSSVAARRTFQAATVDLVVLDIMMPGEDGSELCRHLRATTRIPVIPLTAMAEDTDRIVGLEIGASDYVTKPFNPASCWPHQGGDTTHAKPPPGCEPRSAGTYRFDRWSLDTHGRELVDEAGVRRRLTAPSTTK